PAHGFDEDAEFRRRLLRVCDRTPLLGADVFRLHQMPEAYVLSERGDGTPAVRAGHVLQGVREQVTLRDFEAVAVPAGGSLRTLPVGPVADGVMYVPVRDHAHRDPVHLGLGSETGPE